MVYNFFYILLDSIADILLKIFVSVFMREISL